MDRAFVYFHQGMTDLVICMGLIDYYRELHDEIKVFLRSDAKDFMDFYLRGKDNVEPIYFTGDDGRYYGTITKTPHLDSFSYTSADQNGYGALLLPQDYTMRTHAEHDKWREDQYNHYWYRGGKKPVGHFSEAFYVYYDIPFMTRISSFNVNRDTELEDKVYQEFINEYGEDYVLYHDDENREQTPGKGVPYKSTKINFDNVQEGVSYVNLHRRSNVFFDHIKVLQNAKELHLIDSVWACLAYQLDCKYNLFKSVTVHCQRGHYPLFTNPITLKHWNLI